MGGENLYDRLAGELDGLVFHTTKELRHAAERVGFAFVPVEAVEVTADHGHFVLRPPQIGDVHVYARRTQNWHPFHVVLVEPRGLAA